MKEIINPCHPFANSVEFYHHKSRHTKLDYFTDCFLSFNFFFLTMMKSEVVYYFYGFIVL